MAGDATTKLYQQFTPSERATLVLEALARRDDAEAARLRDTCLRKSYTANDQAFCRRLDVAFDVLALVVIDLRAFAVQVRALRWAANEVRQGCTLHHTTAEMAFLEGTRCGEGLPAMEFFADPAEQAAADAARAAARGTGRVVVVPTDEEDEPTPPPGVDAVGEEAWARRAEAVEAKSRQSTELILGPLEDRARRAAQELVDLWDAFGRFARGRVGVEPGVLLAAFAFPVADGFAAILGQYQDLRPRPANAGEYLDCMSGAWDRRFGTGQ